MQKVLLIDEEKCTGCRLCEAVCSAGHEGASNPSRSRIHVIKREWQGFMMPFICLCCAMIRRNFQRYSA
ncbi:MAG: 4Fe-4S binding protein [Deltaproteobacteria bacterium]|nr:4Fe-4S binding protein [Deltaproteobacteria bacterium]MBW1920649.1 4Fe-4S binding protein [Deltaproteobacteria bacterium]MBW1935717.1 4Fe-4S binding protein [Deltaproteobacteria bacterium]